MCGVAYIKIVDTDPGFIWGLCKGWMRDVLVQYCIEESYMLVAEREQQVLAVYHNVQQIQGG